MIWQDIVITLVCIVFSLSLVPQIYHGFKNKVGPIQYQTSIPTFLGLYIITYTYFTLHLYFSAAMACLTGTLWLMLCVQRAIYNKKPSLA